MGVYGVDEVVKWSKTLNFLCYFIGSNPQNVHSQNIRISHSICISSKKFCEVFTFMSYPLLQLVIPTIVHGSSSDSRETRALPLSPYCYEKVVVIREYKYLSI